MKRSWVISGAIAMALILAGASYFYFAPPPSSLQNSQNQPPRPRIVSVAPVMVKDVPVEIHTVGHVQTIAFVAVRPRIDGIIAEVAVQDGQRVKAGDILFRLDDRQQQAALRGAEANLQRDQAQLANARREVSRLQPLLQKSYATKQQMDSLTSNVAMLEGVVAADEAEIEKNKLTLSYTTIQAPIDGRLGTIEYKIGNLVHANDQIPMVTINQMQPIYVGFSVAQADFTALQLALDREPPKVRVSLPGTDMQEEGVLSYVENAVDQATNTLSAKATFPNLKELLWPGQFVNVVVTLHTEQNALIIPPAALQSNQQGNYVWVVKPDAIVELRPVKIDRTIGNDVVVAVGLKAGEQVVIDGQLNLQEGIKVEIRPSASISATDNPENTL